MDEQRKVLEKILAAAKAAPPKPEAAVVDLSGLEAKLDKLVEVVGGRGERGGVVDLSDLEAKLDKLAVGTGPDLDLSGLEAKLDKLSAPKPEAAAAVDLSGLEAKLDKLLSSPTAPPDSEVERLTLSLSTADSALATANATLEQLQSAGERERASRSKLDQAVKAPFLDYLRPRRRHVPRTQQRRPLPNVCRRF